MAILTNILSFIVAIGILVTVHEFGHFWVARRLGVKVLRFSIGFGPPIWQRLGKDGIEYVIAAIPLGGYVKMLDEREGEVAPEDLPRAFSRKPLSVRFAVVLAGPAFNFLFAIFAYWLMLMVGVTGLRPVVEAVAPDSVASRSGLRPGVEIVAVGTSETTTWQAVVQAVLGKALDVDDGPIPLTVRTQLDGPMRSAELALGPLGVDELTQHGFFQSLGLTPARPRLPAVVGELVAGGPAVEAGFQVGDEIVAANEQSMRGWGDWVDYVRARPQRSMVVTVRRSGETLHLELTPERRVEKGQVFGRVGIAVRQSGVDSGSYYATERLGPLAAIPGAIAKTFDMSLLTLRMLWKMALLEVSVKNISGPISIAQYAGRSAQSGLSRFLEFLGIVSISLGILNLLPIPILDGGHLLYYSVEFFNGRPVSEQVQLFGQRVGVFLLAGLMGLAFFNDFARLFG